MFRGLVNDAKSAVDAAVVRYLLRVAVALLFLLAVGFGIAAGTIALAHRVGAIWALALVAGGFVVLGLIGMMIVSAREKREAEATAAATAHDTEELATDAASQAAVQLPIALLGSLLSSSAGPLSILGVLRFMGRNLSLVLLLGVLGMLMWPVRRSDTDPEVNRASENAAA